MPVTGVVITVGIAMLATRCMVSECVANRAAAAPASRGRAMANEEVASETGANLGTRRKNGVRELDAQYATGVTLTEPSAAKNVPSATGSGATSATGTETPRFLP